MRNNSLLWRWLAFIFVLSFGALGYLGYQIYLTAPRSVALSLLASTAMVLARSCCRATASRCSQSADQSGAT